MPTFIALDPLLGGASSWDAAEARADGLRSCLETWLRSPDASALRSADGYVGVREAAVLSCHSAACSQPASPKLALGASSELNRLAEGDPMAVVAAVRARPQGLLVCDRAGGAVRCRSLLEQVRAVSEVRVASTPGGSVRTLALLREPRLRELLGVISEHAARVRVLLEAARSSELLAENGASIVLRGLGQDDLGWSDSEWEAAPGTAEGTGHAFQGTAQDQGRHQDVMPNTNRGKVCQALLGLLESRSGQLRKSMMPDGSIPASALLEASTPLHPLQDLCFGKASSLLHAAKGLQHQVEVNQQYGTVRLLGFEDRLCSVIEAYLQGTLAPSSAGASAAAAPVAATSRLAETAAGGLTAPLSEILALPAVQVLLRTAPWQRRRGGTATWPVQTSFHRGCPPTGSMCGSGPRGPAWEEPWGGGQEQTSDTGMHPYTYGGWEQASPEALVQEALRSSERLTLRYDEGEAWVALRPPAAQLCSAVEELLSHNDKAIHMLKTEGEVPLSWVAEQGEIKCALQRVGVQGNLEQALELLRAAVQAKSVCYSLDGNGPRASIYPAAQAPVISGGAQTEMTLVGNFGTGVAGLGAIGSMEDLGADPAVADAPRLRLPDLLPSTEVSDCMGRRREAPPRAAAPRPLSSKAAWTTRARTLRTLLVFYFDEFNMQHNRLLVSLAQAQCPVKRRLGQRPPAQIRFRLRDLLALPRLDRLLSTGRGTWRSSLLKAALSLDECQEPLPAAEHRLDTEEPLPPLRLLRVKGVDFLELTRTSNLRLLELVSPPTQKRAKSSQIQARGPPAAASELCPELRTLLDFDTAPRGSVEPLPSHVLLVVSYSVSSDLSHSQSPKAVAAREALYSANLDPQALDWECRLQRLRRQLLYYGSDIVCLQALQSVGFAVRCSEQDSQWFSFEDEPSANHLVHIYRELSKANYGVAFAPTMKLPGSATICLGNAVFWKRSRWRLERHFKLCDSAACVKLASRSGGLPVLVCSTKTAASYVVEWGDQPTQEELLHPLRAVAEGLSREAVAGAARVLWCGDFGCSSAFIRAGLPHLGFQPNGATIDVRNSGKGCSWESAYAALGEEPWTSASRFSAGRAVDHILASGLGRLLAVLGGSPGPADAVELLKSGYPSDHLLLLAAYASDSGSGGGPPGGPDQRSASPGAGVGHGTPGATVPQRQLWQLSAGTHSKTSPGHAPGGVRRAGVKVAEAG